MSTSHRITTTAAAVLALAAVGTPAATAGSPDAAVATATRSAPATVYSRQDKSIIPVSSRSTSADGASTEQAVVRIQTPPSGFDWGDAAIGAAGGLALSLIAVGGALVVSQRRGHRAITPQA
jgi:hypothetical protein